MIASVLILLSSRFYYNRFANECDRGDVSSRLAAASINALIHDLAPLLKENINIKDIEMDKCKIDRAKKKVRFLSKDEQSLFTNLVFIKTAIKFHKQLTRSRTIGLAS